MGGFEAVVAHSMGAAAMAYAMGRGLEAERAVLLAPPVSMERVARRFARMVGLGTQGFERMRRKFETRLGIPWEEFEVTRDAPRIRAATLIVHDKGDPDVPYDECLEVVRAWPTARLLTTEGLGHHRILRDPEVIRQALDFLTGEGGGARRASGHSL